MYILSLTHSENAFIMFSFCRQKTRSITLLQQTRITHKKTLIESYAISIVYSYHKEKALSAYYSAFCNYYRYNIVQAKHVPDVSYALCNLGWRERER